MTLEEVIKHFEEVVKDYERIKCIKVLTLEELKYAEEYRQVVEWLKELKQLRGQTSCHDINVTISMQVPTDSLNHVVTNDVKRLLISNGYDVKHVNVQLAIPIGG